MDMTKNFNSDIDKVLFQYACTYMDKYGYTKRDIDNAWHYAKERYELEHPEVEDLNNNGVMWFDAYLNEGILTDIAHYAEECGY